MGKDKSHDTAQIQRRGEYSTAAAAAVGGACGENFHENNQAQKENHAPKIFSYAVKQTAVQQIIVTFPDEASDGIVAFAIERRQKKNKDTQ